MSEADELRRRLDALEAEMDALRDQITTTRAVVAINDRDVSEFKTELRAHRQVLNALRETQLEQDAKWETRHEALETEMRTGFATILAAVQALTTRLPDDPAGGPADIPAAR